MPSWRPCQVSCYGHAYWHGTKGAHARHLGEAQTPSQLPFIFHNISQLELHSATTHLHLRHRYLCSGSKHAPSPVWKLAFEILAFYPLEHATSQWHKSATKELPIPLCDSIEEESHEYVFRRHQCFKHPPNFVLAKHNSIGKSVQCTL